MRTNSGTSGIGRGGAADLGYGNYENWTSVAQLPSDLKWVEDNQEVYVTMSQNDWNHYLIEMVWTSTVIHGLIRITDRRRLQPTLIPYWLKP